MRRHSSQRTTSSCGAARMRARSTLSELEPAAAAAAVAQLGGGQAAAAGADLLVERDELLADAGDDVGPSGARPCSASASSFGERRRRARTRGSATRATQLGPSRLELGRPAPSSASDRSMTSSSTSSSSAWRRASDASSCWSAWRSLALPCPASSRDWLRAARSRTSWTSWSDFVSSRWTSPAAVRALTISVSSAPSSRRAASTAGVCGRVALACVIWSRRVSMACRSSRRHWRDGSAFRTHLRFREPRGRPARRSHRRRTSTARCGWLRLWSRP